MRAAALRAAAAIDQESFIAVLAGMEPDRHWRVRAALAETLGTLPAELATDRLRVDAAGRGQAGDPGGAVGAGAPEGERPADGARAAARRSGLRRPRDGRARARDAQAGRAAPRRCGRRTRRHWPIRPTPRGRRRSRRWSRTVRPRRTSTLVQALEDKDWAVRVRADELLAKLEPTSAAARTIAPAPGAPIAPYDDPQLIGADDLAACLHRDRPTARSSSSWPCSMRRRPRAASSSSRARGSSTAWRCIGSSPTSSSSMAIREETARAVRATRFATSSTSGRICAAPSAWRSSGATRAAASSSSRISPQPHLDARYTVFGHVVNGMEVVDRIKPGDVIQRIRVWDGSGWVESR